jgi:tetratricopeptide (TPR) repeat protein
MKRLSWIVQAAATLVLAVVPLAAQPADLELTCRPEHALLDQRQERPSDVRDHSPYSTYYLFDNPQLFDLRVSLMNLSPNRLKVADRAGDWARALQVRVQRDGVTLSSDEVRIEPVRRLRRALVYLKDGKAVEQPQFRRRLTSPGAEPLMPYDDYRRDEEVVDELPHELATYEEVVVILRLQAADGRDLPLGRYLLSVADEANHVQCYGKQLVVMRSPRSPLDVIDAHIVRANVYQAEGDLDAAGAELARATELAPDVVKGWVYRSALALARNDLAGQAEAATRLEKLLAEKAGGDKEEFEGVLRDARSVASNAPELRRRLAAQKGEKP